MYIPPYFRQDDHAKLVEFMRAHSFATLISILEGAPFATHLPLMLEERDEQLVITGHLAKPNAHWKGFADAESLAIFGGPHAYISPSLYEKVESVPTWNYIAVHAYGTPIPYTYADAPEKIQGMLETMMVGYDPGYMAQWETLTEKFRAGMMTGIVGFEMVVTRLEGKAKLSQNRSLTDQITVSEHLLHSTDPDIAAIGVAMHNNIKQ